MPKKHRCDQDHFGKSRLLSHLSAGDPMRFIRNRRVPSSPVTKMPLHLTATLRSVVVGLAIFTLAVAWPNSSFCAAYKFLRIPCPVCGGTRSVLALLHGSVVDSFLWNPGLWVAGIIFAFSLWWFRGDSHKANIAFKLAWITGLAAGLFRIFISLVFPSTPLLHLAF